MNKISNLKTNYYAHVDMPRFESKWLYFAIPLYHSSTNNFCLV